MPVTVATDGSLPDLWRRRRTVERENQSMLAPFIRPFRRTVKCRGRDDATPHRSPPEVSPDPR